MLTTALEAARRDIGRDLAVAEPDRVTAGQAADVVSLCAEVERLVCAVKVLFSDRAAQSTRWRDEGHRSAASWMAEKSGTGMGDALNALETSCGPGVVARDLRSPRARRAVSLAAQDHRRRRSGQPRRPKPSY